MITNLNIHDYVKLSTSTKVTAQPSAYIFNIHDERDKITYISLLNWKMYMQNFSKYIANAKELHMNFG